MAYVCFITDVFSRMIVGWRVATTMKTSMVLDEHIRLLQQVSVAFTG
jgi:transposase InsO family protein